MTFKNNSQLFFRIYSGFFGSLCVDRCLLNYVHVCWFFLHFLNSLLENRRVNRAPLCEDWSHPLVSTFHNGNTFIQWCFNSGPVWKTVELHRTNVGCLLWIFLILHLTIKITVVIPAISKPRSNVVLMLGQHRIQWYNIQPTERQVIVLTGDPLNLFPQVYLIVIKPTQTYTEHCV